MKRKFLFFKEHELSDFEPALTRDEIIRRGRILIVDDQQPLLLSELKQQGFSVDYDSSGDDTSNIEKQIYDVVLLDFGGVGLRFGKDQGLSLLKHIRRVAPSTYVLAYTSLALHAKQGDFFRNTHDILEKDAGIADSLKIVEDALRKSMRVQHLWDAIVTLTGVSPGTEQEKQLRGALITALEKHNVALFKKALSGYLHAGLDAALEAITAKIFTLSLLNGPTSN